MSPMPPNPDRVHAERDQQRHHAANSLTIMVGRTQLLQRQILRADGLTTEQREQLLGNLPPVLAETRTLSDQVAALLTDHD